MAEEDLTNKSTSEEVVPKQDASSTDISKASGATEALAKLNVQDFLRTMKDQRPRDMASHKFWGTQPVPRFNEASSEDDGPIAPEDIEKVPKEPYPLLPGFEWVTMDLSNKTEIDDVYQLLFHNYVEDDAAMFRFKYSSSFLNWALKSPGWRKEWHVGIRASASKKLVAFISGVPITLRVKTKTVKCSEINFLCVHKKLRSKRLAPILIKEITRRCHVVGIWQAIYTAGILLPTPVATCRYYHRSLDWPKLYDVGFSPLPSGSTQYRQVVKYRLPENTSMKGLRPLQKNDIPAVLDLLKRYLDRTQIAQNFTKEEAEHWLLNNDTSSADKVVYSYVVETGGRITDFYSFYCLESTVIGNPKHDTVRAAYLFYYATETGLEGDGKDTSLLKNRLNLLMNDALILAKNANFDVFNALSLLDNPLFLAEQKFGPGDGRLHYYLYNWRTALIPGGIDESSELDKEKMGGVGVASYSSEMALSHDNPRGEDPKKSCTFAITGFTTAEVNNTSMMSCNGLHRAQARALRSITSQSRLYARTRSRCLSTAPLRPTCSTVAPLTHTWKSRRHQSGAAAAVLEEALQRPEDLNQETIIQQLSPKEAARLSKVRNIGIAAHIDSGKTTATERVLFYTGRINSIHEVRGKDAVGAKMDSMDLEREKGITIQSAATFCDWVKKEDGKDETYHINLIDTPGHIDFTIEVERALRVLDGAVMILCAVSGVQSQTITVDRQMRRYNIPRISFINKMDRMGANPFKAVDQINHKLKIAAAAVQVPIGSEDNFQGVVDLIRMKAIYNEGEKGLVIRETDEIPADIKQLCEERRAKLIEVLADVDDEMAELFLDEKEPTQEQMKAAVRRATISLKFTPVFMGSALADKSVQPMLDGVCDYLPNPAEVENLALDKRRAEAPVKLVSYSSLPFVGLAFKLEESNFGQLTYIRVYQGTLRKGMNVFNAKTDKKIKIPRIVRMHSNEMEEVPEIGAGEICAVFGVDCASGDTFTDGTLGYSMTSMFVPEPVISLSIKPKNNKDAPNFSKAMNRFQREDPTFRVHVDAESQETIISGMGELHLDIYVERMRREYKVDCETGQPQVAYRETMTERVNFDHTLKKQSGGPGDYARVVGWMEPTGTLSDNKFEQQIVGGAISEKFVYACEKGFQASCEKGPLLGHHVLGVSMVINDGATHMTDSSEQSFKNATQQAFRKTFGEGKPQVLEPVMKTSIVAPSEFQGNIIGLLNKRNAIINESEVGAEDFVLTADCTLNSMFGFSSLLRAATQGKGEFSMEFSHYEKALPQVQRELIAKHLKAQEEKHKK